MIIALQWLIFRRYTTAGTTLWRYILLFRRNNLKLRMNPKWIYIILLSLLWSFGMLLGRYLASTVAERSSTLVLLACIKRNSPIGLLAVIIVPFFISAVICKYFMFFSLILCYVIYLLTSQKQKPISCVQKRAVIPICAFCSEVCFSLQQ